MCLEKSHKAELNKKKGQVHIFGWFSKILLGELEQDYSFGFDVWNFDIDMWKYQNICTKVVYLSGTVLLYLNVTDVH